MISSLPYSCDVILARRNFTAELFVNCGLNTEQTIVTSESSCSPTELLLVAQKENLFHML